MLKILQARLQQGVNPELPDVQAGFKKGGGTRNQIGTTHWIIGKAMGIPEKASPSSSLTKLKPLTVWITANRGKFFKGIFLTQGSHLCLLHCRQILYHLSHQGGPILKKGSTTGHSFFFWVLLISTQIYDPSKARKTYYRFRGSPEEWVYLVLLIKATEHLGLMTLSLSCAKYKYISGRRRMWQWYFWYP